MATGHPPRSGPTSSSPWIGPHDRRRRLSHNRGAVQRPRSPSVPYRSQGAAVLRPVKHALAPLPRWPRGPSLTGPARGGVPNGRSGRRASGRQVEQRNGTAGRPQPAVRASSRPKTQPIPLETGISQMTGLRGRRWYSPACRVSIRATFDPSDCGGPRFEPG